VRRIKKYDSVGIAKILVDDWLRGISDLDADEVAKHVLVSITQGSIELCRRTLGVFPSIAQEQAETRAKACRRQAREGGAREVASRPRCVLRPKSCSTQGVNNVVALGGLDYFRRSPVRCIKRDRLDYRPRRRCTLEEVRWLRHQTVANDECHAVVRSGPGHGQRRSAREETGRMEGSRPALGQR
jgi:hypothetical protein